MLYFGDNEKMLNQTNKLWFLELVRFSGHLRYPPGWYDSGLKEMSARNPSVERPREVCRLTVKSDETVLYHLKISRKRKVLDYC